MGKGNHSLENLVFHSFAGAGFLCFLESICLKRCFLLSMLSLLSLSLSLSLSLFLSSDTFQATRIIK